MWCDHNGDFVFHGVFVKGGGKWWLKYRNSRQIQDILRHFSDLALYYILNNRNNNLVTLPSLSTCCFEPCHIANVLDWDEVRWQFWQSTTHRRRWCNEIAGRSRVHAGQQPGSCDTVDSRRHTIVYSDWVCRMANKPQKLAAGHCRIDGLHEYLFRLLKKMSVNSLHLGRDKLLMTKRENGIVLIRYTGWQWLGLQSSGLVMNSFSYSEGVSNEKLYNSQFRPAPATAPAAMQVWLNLCVSAISKLWWHCVDALVKLVWLVPTLHG